MCMWVSVSVYHTIPVCMAIQEGKKALGLLELELQAFVNSLTGPLEEQQVLLTTKLPFQLQILVFCKFLAFFKS